MSVLLHITFYNTRSILIEFLLPCLEDLFTHSHLSGYVCQSEFIGRKVESADLDGREEKSTVEPRGKNCHILMW